MVLRMNHVLLDLGNVAHISHEKLFFGLDIELHDLAVFQLYQVDLICHPLDIINAMARHFDDFFADRNGSIVDAKCADLGRSNQEIAWYGIDPDGTAHLTLRLFELHFGFYLLGRVEEDLAIRANHQEDILSGTKNDVLHHGW